MSSNENITIKAFSLKRTLRLISGGAFSACIAETLTIPFDTAKVNLQLNTSAKGEKKIYNGFLDFFVKTVRKNGLKSLWNGLSPGLYRQVLYAGIRLGSYDTAKIFIRGKKEDRLETTVFEKIGAAFVTGTIAITIAQPADLLKVRIQGEMRTNPKNAKYQNGVMAAFKRVVRTEGILGLWNGVVPNIARNSTTNVAELVTYDIFKNFFIQNKIFGDNVACHITSALSAGFVGTVVGSPLDVIKTRVLNSGAKGGVFKNMKNILMKEGFFAFYKGFLPYYSRIGSWNLVMFLTFEEVKKLMSINPH